MLELTELARMHHHQLRDSSVRYVAVWYFSEPLRSDVRSLISYVTPSHFQLGAGRGKMSVEFWTV